MRHPPERPHAHVTDSITTRWVGHTQYNEQQQTDVGMGWTRTVLPAAADGRRTDTHTQPAATVAYPTDASADIAHAQRRMHLPSAYPDTSSSKDGCEASLPACIPSDVVAPPGGLGGAPYLQHYLMFPVTLDFKVWFQNVDPCISGGSTFQRAADIPTLFIGCVYRKSRLGACRTKCGKKIQGSVFRVGFFSQPGISSGA